MKNRIVKSSPTTPSISMKNSLLKRKQNRGTDNLATPAEALIPLLKYLPKNIWECATGEGKLAGELERHGHRVFRGYDFLNDTCTLKDVAIVTNPPFSLKTKFLERAYELDIPFAFLLPITALEGARRQKLYRENGIDVIFLPKRIDFTGKKAPWFAVAWFVHKLKVPNTLNFPLL